MRLKNLKIENNKIGIKEIIFSAFLVTAIFFIFSIRTHAATLYFVPESQNSSVGGTINVSLKIDTENVDINAVQATVKFQAANLQLESVDKTNSIFSFWLGEPVISNTDGTMTFIAGLVKGVSGSALQAINLKFKVTGSGIAQISLIDSSVSANDGKGTDVLSSTKTASIGVGAGAQVVTTLPVATSTRPVEQPQQISRPAIAATGLPIKPILRLPLYPDSERWYNQLGNVISLWTLPEDVNQISARLTQRQTTSIGIPESQLTNGKDFGIINEGIQYVRVQFKNNVGWGEPAYFKVSLDTTPPLPFDIKINSEKSDNPSPIIGFETRDSLSGIDKYAILIDGVEILKTTSSTLALPPQAPGKHTLMVRAYDLAQNSVSDTIAFEITPLEKPVVQFYQKSIPAGELLFFSGSAVPLENVEIRIMDAQNQGIASKSGKADSLGHWEIRLDQYIPAGTYNASAIAKDERGAASYPTDPVKISVSEKVIFSIAGLNFGWFDISLIVLMIAMGLGGYFWRRNIMAEDKRAAYRIIAGRDFQNLSELLENNINEYEKFISRFNIDEKSKMENDFIFKKIKDTAEKIRKYIGKELENIK